MPTEAIPDPLAQPRSNRRRSRDHTVVAIAGGALVLAMVAAGAGWALRGASQPPMVAGSSQTAPAPLSAPTTAALTPAPDDRPPVVEQAPPVPPSPVAQKPAPVRTERVPAVREQAPPPVVAQAPQDVERARPVAVCQHCGVVESVRSVQKKGDAQGVGAVAGGVLGAVLGNQVGGGNGRTAMTVLGAVGGGMAGHEVEKRVRSETVYEVRVRMDNGTTRTITQHSAPAQGSRVTVDNNGVHAM